MPAFPDISAGYWWFIILSGCYHGLNPGMGWPLAVSAGLTEQRLGAVFKALGLLALGHFLSMLIVLLPFSLLSFLVTWQVPLRIGAASLVMGMGIFLLIRNRHPRFLARIHPARLILWSFLISLAHGAGLMLLPVLLGIHGEHAHHMGGDMLMQQSLGVAVGIALVHSLAMLFSGALIAIAIYQWLGLKFLSRTWFNLDRLWAISLIVVGAFALIMALTGH